MGTEGGGAYQSTQRKTQSPALRTGTCHIQRMSQDEIWTIASRSLQWWQALPGAPVCAGGDHLPFMSRVSQWQWRSPFPSSHVWRQGPFDWWAVSVGTVDTGPQCERMCNAGHSPHSLQSTTGSSDVATVTVTPKRQNINFFNTRHAHEKIIFYAYFNENVTDFNNSNTLVLCHKNLTRKWF